MNYNRYAPLPRRFYLYIQEKDEAHNATSSDLGSLEITFEMNERNMPHPVYDILGHSRGCAINIQYTTDGTSLYPLLPLIVFQTFQIENG